MVTTTFAAVVLSAVLSPSAVSPNWQSDYGTALTAAADQQKPLAVFISRGEAGYAALVGGKIPTEAGQLLGKSYVCLYVNTDTTEGKNLAGQFALSDGLVISNKGGDLQALRHNGAVSPEALTSYLTKYSGQTAVVRTETVGAIAPATIVPAGAVVGGCANGRCGLSTGYYQPAQPVQGYTAPAAVVGGCANGRCGLSTGYYQPARPVQGYSAPAFGGGCANGRCPTVR